MRLTTTYPRMAFTESTSLKLPTHGLRVEIPRKKNSNYVTCASPLRILTLRSSQDCQDVQQWLALKFSLASPPHACARLYLRIAPATCAFTLRLSRSYPRAEPSTLSLLTSWRLRAASSLAPSHCASLQLTLAHISPTSMHSHTALITDTFTPRFTTTYIRINVTKSPLHFASLQLIFARLFLAECQDFR